MTKRKKPGPKPGTMPKNYEQFRAAAKETQFAPGYSGQSTKQVKETQHLKDWLNQYDINPEPVATPNVAPIVERVPGESQSCPPVDEATKVTMTHAERVREMLDKLKPEPSRMIDNDPNSLIKNYKG